MTLGAVAASPRGRHHPNVGHIRHKETDRLTALATELAARGGGPTVTDDGPDDHDRGRSRRPCRDVQRPRMAMSLALVA